MALCDRARLIDTGEEERDAFGARPLQRRQPVPGLFDRGAEADGQRIEVVAQLPWVLWPVAFVVVAVLMFNFLGDGLRDAADPYVT